MKKQVIEVEGVPLGIVVPHEGRVKFVAVKWPVIDLDGHVFLNADDARIRIRNYLSRHDDFAAA